MKTLEVLFSPAEFNALKDRDLSQTVCVVFDVLRATSSMVTALANGAPAIIPVSEISDALAVRNSNPQVLLAGERHGLHINRQLTGGIDFDLGNSPREFTQSVVAGKTIVMTTTNGTRALRACAKAREILVASFLNLQATADALQPQNTPNLLLICSGTFEEAAYEDVLGAGALCDLLWPLYSDAAVADSALMARDLFRIERNDLVAAISRSRNGRRLLLRPELRDDVSFCARLGLWNVVAALNKDGAVRLIDC